MRWWRDAAARGALCRGGAGGLNPIVHPPLELALLVLAPKYISSAEVALVLLLETVLSPLWTYIGVGEEPTVWTLAGGGLLVAVLTLHEVAAMRTEVTAADSEGSGTQKRQQGAAGKEDAAAGAVSAAVVEVTAT